MFNKISNQDIELLKKLYPNNYQEKLDKLNDNYPIQYLIGYVDFYGYIINVDERVLIPRFETEYLVKDTIELINKYIDNPTILDIGCGSGCISITLSKELNTEVFALDISKDAIDLAKDNAELNDAKINFINQDIKDFISDKKYNVLVSNPPYVSYSESVGLETKYEPQNAIFASNNGLEYYEIILSKCKSLLNDKNIICFEIGNNQGNFIKDIALSYYPNANIIIKKDLNNYERYIYIINI